MKLPRSARLFATIPLLLTACATTPPPEPEIKRAQPPPQEIHIHTAPPGAIVDWNGNVLGTTPIVISLTPYLAPYASHYRWPSNPDGAFNTEFFDTNTPPPQQIAIISPSIGNYRHLWPAPGRKELQIKKGP